MLVLGTYVSGLSILSKHDILNCVLDYLEPPSFHAVSRLCRATQKICLRRAESRLHMVVSARRAQAWLAGCIGQGPDPRRLTFDLSQEDFPDSCSGFLSALLRAQHTYACE